MATRRDALVKVGLAKPGRGKFSTEANAWLAAQRAEGVTFDDDNAPVKTKISTAPKKSEKSVPKVETGVGYPDYVFPSDYRFPEGEYKLTVPANFPYQAKSVGLRNVCETCRISFVNHICEAPRLFGFTVKIERR